MALPAFPALPDHARMIYDLKDRVILCVTVQPVVGWVLFNIYEVCHAHRMRALISCVIHLQARLELLASLVLKLDFVSFQGAKNQIDNMRLR